MPVIGWTASAAVVVILLGICFALLISTWDRTKVPPHRTVRLVRCPRHGRVAEVEFMEQVRTGMTMRTVVHCPVRSSGERCGEECVWEAELGATD
jgi:hypothetical protein